MNVVDQNGLEVLPREECLRLLASATLGRVAVSVNALPVVLPVNFRLIEDQIVFRTGPGTKLDAAANDSVVAFEVDQFDSFSHAGWSVLVTGLAREVVDPDEQAKARGANIPRWAPRGDGRIVAISTDIVTGRRLEPGLMAADVSDP